MSDSMSKSATTAAGASPSVSVDASTTAAPSDFSPVSAAPTADAAPAPAPKPARSVACAISLVIGIAYVAYLVWALFVKADGAGALRSFVNALDLARVIGGDEVGRIVAMDMGLFSLVYVHLAFAGAGLLCNLLALATNRAGLALTAALCYAMAALAFCVYLPFVLPELMLCCVAFGSTRERRKRFRAARTAAGR